MPKWLDKTCSEQFIRVNTKIVGQNLFRTEVGMEACLAYIQILQHKSVVFKGLLICKIRQEILSHHETQTDNHLNWTNQT